MDKNEFYAIPWKLGDQVDVMGERRWRTVVSPVVIAVCEQGPRYVTAVWPGRYFCGLGLTPHGKPVMIEPIREIEYVYTKPSCCMMIKE